MIKMDGSWLIHYGPIGVAVLALGSWLGFVHKTTVKVQADLAEHRNGALTRAEFKQEMAEAREATLRELTLHNTNVTTHLAHINQTLGRFERRLDAQDAHRNTHT